MFLLFFSGIGYLLISFFFFSSRRRHTRWTGDWSSDVCSSDLESTYNLFFKLRYAKVYDAMLATPIGPLDVALGEIGWAVLRGGIYAVAFLGVAVSMGLL